MATILDNSFVENFHLHACMLSCSVQLSCPALCNPMDCSLPGSSRQEYGSGLPFPSSRDLPNPGIEPTSPALAGRFFTTEPLGNPTYPYHKWSMLCTSRDHLYWFSWLVYSNAWTIHQLPCQIADSGAGGKYNIGSQQFSPFMKIWQYVLIAYSFTLQWQKDWSVNIFFAVVEDAGSQLT